VHQDNQDQGDNDVSPFVQGLRRVFDERPDLTPAGLARDAGLDNSAIRKMFERNSRGPTLHNAARIASVLGLTIDEILARASGRHIVRQSIAIAGKVGAGARVPLVDAYEKGDGPQVECPPGLSCHGIVAVEVEGDSMEPVYSSGDLIFYSRHTHDNVPAEAVGRRCVVMDRSGHVWLKQLKLGREPNTFDLHSINAAVATMYGVRLEWAAPVRLHWPAALAVKAEGRQA
jgi:DNA-binding XRE family transcriptional regulator